MNKKRCKRTFQCRITEVHLNNATFSGSTKLTIFSTEMTRSRQQHHGQRLRLTRASAGSGHHSLFSLRAPLPSPFLPIPSQWLANGRTARNTYAAAPASLLEPCEEIAVSVSASCSCITFQHAKCFRILKINRRSTNPLNAEHHLNELIGFTLQIARRAFN